MHRLYWARFDQSDPSAAGEALSPPVIRMRLRWLYWAFIAGLLTVFGRLVAVDWHDGADYRAAAAEPLRRMRTIAAPRGKILARDGTVLATDRPIVDLALNYRWLEEPADPRWLRALARSRLTARERRDPQQVAEQTRAILDQRQQLWRRLAALCDLTDPQWQTRRARIQRKVEAIATSVAARQRAIAANQAQLNEPNGRPSANSNFAHLVGQSLLEALFAADDAPASAHVTVAEEITEHVVFEGISLAAVAEIEAHPQQYPGVQLQHSFRREYPERTLAAHMLGYLGAPRADELRRNSIAEGSQAAIERLRDDRAGRAGIERQYEANLHGQPGVIFDEIDLRGKVIASNTAQEAQAGQNLVITLDPALQRAAEELLDQAMARRIVGNAGEFDLSSGGAVVVMDLHDGALFAAASAPRFDPNAFIERDHLQIQKWFAASDRPLFDRTIQMALPPGSVFKIVSAAALVASGVDPSAPVDCAGYLHQPDALRCAIYRRLGIGHGPVTLVDALARSCNVYFFHYAEQVGAMPLVNWGNRFGMGTPSGIDLPGEVRGSFPSPRSDAGDSSGDAAHPISRSVTPDPRLISIGQGPVTTTPLQMARVIAAIANGGTLVTPHVVERIRAPLDESAGGRNRDVAMKVAPPVSVPGITAPMLEVIRRGLRQAVANGEGTAHDTVDLDVVAIAGKTGTAEVGGHRPEHAWFAGYAPADQPRVAFVVVLEHAGEASTTAGPVVQRLVKRMQELGYFSNSKLASTRR